MGRKERSDLATDGGRGWAKPQRREGKSVTPPYLCLLCSTVIVRLGKRSSSQRREVKVKLFQLTLRW
jgi:hypothetical protein